MDGVTADWGCVFMKEGVNLMTLGLTGMGGGKRLRRTVPAWEG